MSKPVKPENIEPSTSETGKYALKIEKDMNSGVQDSQSVVQTKRSADQTVPTDQSSGTDGQTIEIGGQSGPEPTRFGDWEKNGRCTDF